MTASENRDDGGINKKVLRKLRKETHLPTDQCKKLLDQAGGDYGRALALHESQVTTDRILAGSQTVRYP